MSLPGRLMLDSPVGIGLAKDGFVKAPNFGFEPRFGLLPSIDFFFCSASASSFAFLSSSAFLSYSSFSLRSRSSFSFCSRSSCSLLASAAFLSSSRRCCLPCSLSRLASSYALLASSAVLSCSACLAALSSSSLSSWTALRSSSCLFISAMRCSSSRLIYACLASSMSRCCFETNSSSSLWRLILLSCSRTRSLSASS